MTACTNSKHEDYNYIPLLRKAIEHETDISLQKDYHAALVHSETHRDFYMGSIKQFKTLSQVDIKPDYELKEAKWDLFKISMSDISRGSLKDLLVCKLVQIN